MANVVFFLMIVAGVMLGQIAVEVIKDWIRLKFAKKQTETIIDAAFAKLGNIGLQSILSRSKGGGSDEV